MTANNRVSVIIPSYNSQTHITECIRSVLLQTYQNIEIIVVDDGSTDMTSDVLAGFDEKISIIKQKNQGAAAARNRGAAEAKGSWLAFLDSDDVWAPEKIEKQLLHIKSCRWSYTDMQFVGGVNDGLRDSKFTVKYEGNVQRELLLGNFISTSTMIINKQTFFAAGGFDESIRSVQDWELWTRVALNNPIAYLNEPMALYRVHPSSTSRNTRKTLPSHLMVIDIIFKRMATDSEMTKLKSRAKAKSCGICSYISEEEGDMAFAFKCAFQACIYEPFSRRRWTRLIKALLKMIYNRLSRP